ncbi:hypothetical protein [Herpetosiphon llansteffanensis]|uniref:hypothetical protein n=1 Tax=Herpetosiphon llansteffanensis TaxID=2094568 RepID=UPI000D7CD201|nr:hypothetical protein [Herpetosiphon llansteffanensis]
MTLINLAGTQLQVQEYLRAGQLAAARNLLINRNISPRLIAKWLTPEQQEALGFVSPELMAEPKIDNQA